MGKKVVSFNLSEKSYNLVTDTAKALGISRSEVMEDFIQSYEFPIAVQELVKEISELQEKAYNIVLKGSNSMDSGNDKT